MSPFTNTQLEVKYARSFRRLSAFLIDLFLIFTIYRIACFVGLLEPGHIIFSFGKYFYNMHSAMPDIILTLILILYWVVPTASKSGATLGKRICGIFVITNKGEQLTIARSFVRWCSFQGIVVTSLFFMIMAFGNVLRSEYSVDFQEYTLSAEESDFIDVINNKVFANEKVKEKLNYKDVIFNTSEYVEEYDAALSEVLKDSSEDEVIYYQQIINKVQQKKALENKLAADIMPAIIYATVCFLLLFCGFLNMLFSGNKATIHDIFSSTKVVRAKKIKQVVDY